MRYFARLKEIENEKISDISPVSELTKPPKGASVSFGSFNPEENKKISYISANESEKIEMISLAF